MRLFIETVAVLAILYGIYRATFDPRSCIRVSRAVGVALLIVGVWVLPMTIKAMLVIVAFFYIFVKKMDFCRDFRNVEDWVE
jgi:ribose/xylose/arabinose/galactoside ABC-type transport system permease subunit